MRGSKRSPTIDEYAVRTCRIMGKRFDALEPKMRAIVAHHEHLSPAARQVLVEALCKAILEAAELVTQLESLKPRANR